MSREPNRQPLLALNHVTVIRGERAALDDLSLRIEAGEHICILGPNGCGKSTLIKTITRECYPLANEQSSMSILGRECWDIFELRSRLGIVSPDLLASCTSDATGRAVAQMSSGEAKRALIARALVHEPQTLLFDEPSNTLDIAAQIQLRETMRQLAQAGLGILLVTHHVSEVIPEIERVVLLREGRILADGPKEEILTAARLTDLFGVPVQLVRRDGYFHSV